MGHSRQSVLIAGAGIAGLATALALAREGMAVHILERSPTLTEIGAGLQLPPNATRLLAKLGVLERLGGKALQPIALDMREAASGRLMTSLPLGEQAIRRWGAPYLVAHRADLQAALAEAAGDHPSIRIEMAAEVDHVRTDEHGVSVTLADGERRAGTILIGADGVWSRVRSVIQSPGSSEFSGYLAWRSTLAAGAVPAGLLAPDRITVFFSPRFHLVAYPVRAGSLVNLVAITRGASPDRRWDVDMPTRPLAEAMDGTSTAPLVEPARWTAWPLHEVDPQLPWHRGRIALVGDAAHALTPFAAQGTAMAVEDAAVLAACLSAEPSAETAFRRYEAVRKPRLSRVARRGAFNRFAWHAAGPVALARNLVLALRPAERMMSDFDWLYGPEPAGPSRA